MNEWMGPRGHNVAVLFSENSRKVYVQQAREREETYTFVDAEGRHRTWLKSEHAYLALNGASVFLSRCNLKHDVLTEEQLTDATLATLSALVIPNAGWLKTFRSCPCSVIRTDSRIGMLLFTERSALNQ